MPPRRRRPRGHIEELRSGRFRAIVYAGVDPLTGKQRYLKELADSYSDAELVLTRLQSRVDENRHPKSAITCAAMARTTTGSRVHSAHAHVLAARLSYHLYHGGGVARCVPVGRACGSTWPAARSGRWSWPISCSTPSRASGRAGTTLRGRSPALSSSSAPAGACRSPRPGTSPAHAAASAVGPPGTGRCWRVRISVQRVLAPRACRLASSVISRGSNIGWGAST